MGVGFKSISLWCLPFVVMACAKSDSRRVPLNDEEKGQVAEYVGSMKTYSEANGHYMAVQSLVESSHTLFVWASDAIVMADIGTRTVDEYLILQLREKEVVDFFPNASAEDLGKFLRFTKERFASQNGIWQYLAKARRSLPADDIKVEMAFRQLQGQNFLQDWSRKEAASLQTAQFQTPADSIERQRVQVEPQSKLTPDSKAYATYGQGSFVHVDGAKLGALMFIDRVHKVPPRPAFRNTMQQAINSETEHRFTAYKVFAADLTQIFTEGARLFSIHPEFSEADLAGLSPLEILTGEVGIEDLKSAEREKYIKDLSTEDERMKYDTLDKVKALQAKAVEHFYLAQRWVQTRTWHKAVGDEKFRSAELVWVDYSKLVEKFNMETTALADVLSSPDRNLAFRNSFVTAYRLAIATIHKALAIETSPQDVCGDAKTSITALNSLPDKIPGLSEQMSAFVAATKICN